MSRQPRSPTSRQEGDREYTVTAPVDCTGRYTVRASSEEEARERFEAWDGSDEFVTFDHYAEEIPGPADTVEEC